MGRVAQLVINGILESTESATAVQDGLPLREFCRLLAEDFGYHLEPLDENDWFQRLESALEQEQGSHPLFPFFHILRQEVKSVGSDGLLQGDTAQVRDVIRRNVQHLIDVGLLPAGNSILSN